MKHTLLDFWGKWSNRNGRLWLWLSLAMVLWVGNGCESPSCCGGRPQAKVTVLPPAQPASAQPTAPEWISMFDGETLKGWKITDFAGKGEVEVKNEQIILGMGVMTGISWTNELLRMDYEVEIEAMRKEGSDFFCGFTFPVGEACCSLIVGGWGGGTVGISSLDGMDASENETSKFMNFENGRWYKIRVRITKKKIEAWIDKDKVVDVVTTDRKITVRPGEIEASQPFGIATWSTTGALREMRMRRLAP